MKLTYLSQTFFPFLVPEKDGSFASSVGAQTVYPAGFSLERALQIYWRAKNYQVTAAGDGVLGGVSQALRVDGLLPARNEAVGTNFYYELDGFTPVGPGDLVTGRGVRQVMPGTGTVTASGDAGTGTNSGALFNLQVDLFYPETTGIDPVVKYGGLWWPAMSVSCVVSNTVTLDGGGELSINFEVSSFNPDETTEIGTFSFFGTVLPVYCAGLAPPSGSDPGETRTFSGAITVSEEWA